MDSATLLYRTLTLVWHFHESLPQTTCVLLLDLSLSHVCPQLSPLQTLSWLQPCAEEPRTQPGETHQGSATFLSFLLTPSCQVAWRSRHESHLKSCHHLYQELVQPAANLLLPPTSVPTLASGEKILSPPWPRLKVSPTQDPRDLGLRLPFVDAALTGVC